LISRILLTSFLFTASGLTLGDNRYPIRPELLIVVILIVSIPALGYIGYQNIMYQYDKYVTSFISHPCVYSSKGFDWDLTSLTRSERKCNSWGMEDCTDHHMHTGSSDFFLNICNNVMHKPVYCSSDLPRAIGYDVSDGECYNMGSLKTGKWDLLDSR
jgi:hypothetical protein